MYGLFKTTQPHSPEFKLRSSYGPVSPLIISIVRADPCPSLPLYDRHLAQGLAQRGCSKKCWLNDWRYLRSLFWFWYTTLLSWKYNPSNHWNILLKMMFAEIKHSSSTEWNHTQSSQTVRQVAEHGAANEAGTSGVSTQDDGTLSGGLVQGHSLLAWPTSPLPPPPQLPSQT